MDTDNGEIAELRQRIKELEEECDLLAFDNHRLRQENVKLLTLSPHPAPMDEGAMVTDSYFFEEGDGMHARSVQSTIESACDGANVISVAFCRPTDCCNSYKLICCGGANNMLNFFKIPINSDEDTHQKVFSYLTTGPILTIDSNRLYPLVSVGSMDGKLHVIDYSTQFSNECVHIFNDHQKYVICTKFSPDGSLLATGSHDKTVHLYKIVTDGPSFNIEKLTTIRFENIVESLIFVEKSADRTLVIAPRDSLDLVYFNCVTLQKQLVNLNAYSWDTHRSITPLVLSSSPDGKFILVGTDKNMHILYQTGTNKRVRTFAGHNSGQYGKPRVSFSNDGKYIYSNSEGENCVYVFSVASEKVEYTLSSHSNIIRDVCGDVADNSLLTCSYDKSVKYWM